MHPHPCPSLFSFDMEGCRVGRYHRLENQNMSPISSWIESVRLDTPQNKTFPICEFKQ
ncbi:hypothetical protein PHLGIDRAFT_255783 [Phlebiopsis gigantea 11061_1 CR5-6]|uniref:Uncharacterized protein n=1 Tax=Phlebiopsis gigantea (strain 11061_1 CR5-6) TaxID=745531 RepID=A0A0C3RS41_PHLG1|nr:hypothetical protein PHLGIDRAFT_255783 [Phlebiopsis gigantea 11061_1 CR5-6]